MSNIMMVVCEIFGNMSVFVRNILGIVIMIGLFSVIGCSTAQSGRPTATNALPWAKKEEPERAQQKSMNDLMRKPRVSEQIAEKYGTVHGRR